MNCLPKNTIIECGHCCKYYRVPINISEGMLPVKFGCPECKGEILYQEFRPLPKVCPTNEYKYCTVYGTHKTVSEVAKEQSEEKSPEEPDIIGLDDRIKSIKNLAGTIFTEIGSLRDELSNIGNALFKDVVKELVFASRFLDIDFTEYANFLTAPFGVIKIPCLSNNSARHSRYIISPRFFNLKFGSEVTLQGMSKSLQCQLLNHHTRLTHFIDDDFCDVFSVPKNLDLKVVGSRLIGTGIKFLQRNNIHIPGTIPDIDSTEETPTARIIRTSARTWLTKNAIPAFSVNPIQTEDIRQTINDEIIDYCDFCFQQFKNHGRVMIFGNDYRQLLRGMSYAMDMIRGQKFLVATKDEDEIVSKLCIPETKICTAKVNDFTLETSKSFWMEHGRQIKFVFVNAYDGIVNIKKILSGLLDYDNIRIFIIAKDPELDTNERDIIGSLLYSLCPYWFQLEDASSKQTAIISNEAEERKTNSQYELYRAIKRLKDTA